MSRASFNGLPFDILVTPGTAPIPTRKAFFTETHIPKTSTNPGGNTLDAGGLGRPHLKLACKTLTRAEYDALAALQDTIATLDDGQGHSYSNAYFADLSDANQLAYSTGTCWFSAEFIV